jgi:hypothetical protein
LPRSKLLDETGVVGFFERNRDDVAKAGYDPNRLPPGQYLTDRFPVLHVGDVPEYAPGEWNLRVFGLVDNEYTLTFEELTALPSVELVTDIHCVTKWSKFDTRWRGVKVSDLLARAGMQSGATHFMGHAEYGYTATRAKRSNPFTAVRCACSCLISTSGSLRSGCAASRCVPVIHRVSGSATDTTCTEIRSSSSAFGVTEPSLSELAGLSEASDSGGAEGVALGDRRL